MTNLQSEVPSPCGFLRLVIHDICSCCACLKTCQSEGVTDMLIRVNTVFNIQNCVLQTKYLLLYFIGLWFSFYIIQ